MKILKRTRIVVVLLTALVFLAACGIEGDSWAGVSASDDNEIFVSNERFIAKLASNGERLWVYPSAENRGPNFYAPVTYDGDVVFIGDYNGGVHAVDRASGEGLWIYEQSGTELFGLVNFGGAPDRVIGAVTVDENFVYVPDEQGIFLLDKETGERISDWKFETERAVWSQPILFTPDGRETPVLYFTALDHHLYAIEPDNAELIWKTDLGGATPGTPSINEDGTIFFVGTFDFKIFAVDVVTGDILADYETEGWVWDAPAVVGDELYFGDLNGYLYALTYDEDGFTETWKSLISEEGKLRARPIVDEGLVIVPSTDKNLYGVARDTGEVEWTENVDREVVSSVVQVTAEGESLVVTATDNVDELLIGFGLTDGNKRWSYEHKD